MSDDIDNLNVGLTSLLDALQSESMAASKVRFCVFGDSGAWTFGDAGFTQVLGGKSASVSGVSPSAVSGLPRVPSTVEAVEVIVDSGQAMLLGNDGFGDPLGGGTGEVGRLFGAVLGQPVPSLVEFAHALDFSRETFDDDRTLVAIWPHLPAMVEPSHAGNTGTIVPSPPSPPQRASAAPHDSMAADGGRSSQADWPVPGPSPNSVGGASGVSM